MCYVLYINIQEETPWTNMGESLLFAIYALLDVCFTMASHAVWLSITQQNICFPCIHPPFITCSAALESVTACAWLWSWQSVTYVFSNQNNRKQSSSTWIWLWFLNTWRLEWMCFINGCWSLYCKAARCHSAPAQKKKEKEKKMSRLFK